MKKILVSIAVGALVLGAYTIYGTAAQAVAEKDKTDSPIYSLTMKRLDGKPESLGDYKGKVLLIVNTASKCGFTPQYAGLQKIYDTYKDKGFVVLGFPANNFLGQEPGTDGEIATFCESRFHVTFPMFSKISVKGDDIAPLYDYLTNKSPVAGDVKWNFQKYLIDRKGRVIAKFHPRVEPTDERVIKAIEEALKEDPEKTEKPGDVQPQSLGF
jgi:glutathione peroxidase